MKLIHWGIAAAPLCIACSATAAPRPQPGIYTNEEEVYFDGLAKRPVAPWLSLKIDTAGGMRIAALDAFQKAVSGEFAASQLASAGKDRIRLTLPAGTVTELRRARPVTCWVAIRKDKPKADGSEDWYFQPGVKLHDQGGRAIVGGGETGTQPVMIRVRNVTWDKGSTNAPVITLYIHKPENWDRAESYSWAAPDSARVGINLRWMQTGCAVDGLAKPSAITNSNFRG